LEAIQITVRVDEFGKATPLAFTWQERNYIVESTGRRWEDEEGQHILVMIPGGRVFEMLYAAGEGRWYLQRTGADRMSA
jgi:hypothetical protein